jgi:hypothetical protein
VANVHGYRVVTAEGKTIGRVIGESELALVVKFGIWPRRAVRALPKSQASIKDEEQSVVTPVSKEFLAQSPKLKRSAPVDDAAVASWWALD